MAAQQNLLAVCPRLADPSSKCDLKLNLTIFCELYALKIISKGKISMHSLISFYEYLKL